MLRRFLDYQREPKQLVGLPFRILGMAAALYLLFGGSPWYSERTHVAALVMVAGLVATMVIDVAWWGVQQHRERLRRRVQGS
jgi:hypothetical protein